MEYFDPLAKKESWFCKKHKIAIAGSNLCPLCEEKKRRSKNRSRWKRIEYYQSEKYIIKNRKHALEYYYKHKEEILNKRHKKNETSQAPGRRDKIP